jgi:GWxTD domain-containing protein
MVFPTRRLALLATVLAIAARVPTPVSAASLQGADEIRDVLDPVATYRNMGLLVAGEPLPFVASIRFLSASDPDSTLVVFGLSLANRALSFRREDSHFEARYSVDMTFKESGLVKAHLPAEETIRVASYGETLRRDESIVFQKFFLLAPGPLVADVRVVDGYGADTSRSELQVEVPRFGAQQLSSIVWVYQGAGRSSVDAMPTVVVNPRASVPYGLDSLRFYLEGYGMPQGAVAHVRITDSDESEMWVDSVTLGNRDATFSAALVSLPSDRLAVGTLNVEVTLGDRGVAMSSAMVALSDDRPVPHLTDLVSSLRYFHDARWVEILRAAAPEERADTWREFWIETDPDPETPQNEALDWYFIRVDEANVRFREPGTPGWLTDRGEVFVTLGVPDDVRNIEPDRSSGGQRLVRWRYLAERLTLYFVDEGNFGRLRLTPASRAEYASAAERKREGRDG